METVCLPRSSAPSPELYGVPELRSEELSWRHVRLFTSQNCVAGAQWAIDGQRGDVQSDIHEGGGACGRNEGSLIASDGERGTCDGDKSLTGGLGVVGMRVKDAGFGERGGGFMDVFRILTFPKSYIVLEARRSLPFPNALVWALSAVEGFRVQRVRRAY
ncbi:hypothetical protein BD311DRAFT_42214 [Dichomitus squalens]|uniref:Uncharacterized protein n=1 Tax=Dichomitus squalens TaxID=114155 RepID=A0A4Q9MCM0_9APHY|nr:hypothetical protein BD311DRAFT_42214 [Dichomitus squalens]